MLSVFKGNISPVSFHTESAIPQRYNFRKVLEQSDSDSGQYDFDLILITVDLAMLCGQRVNGSTCDHRVTGLTRGRLIFDKLLFSLAGNYFHFALIFKSKLFSLFWGDFDHQPVSVVKLK